MSGLDKRTTERMRAAFKVEMSDQKKREHQSAISEAVDEYPRQTPATKTLSWRLRATVFSQPRLWCSQLGPRSRQPTLCRATFGIRSSALSNPYGACSTQTLQPTTVSTNSRNCSKTRQRIIASPTPFLTLGSP